jgi:hypothetical protein
MKMEKIAIIAIITIVFSAGICLAAEEYAKDPAASAQSGKIENNASNTTLPQYNNTTIYILNDAHCHYVNFTQESEGMQALLNAMNSSNVDQIVLFGLPVTKKWDDEDPQKPNYYDDDDSETYYYSMTDVIVARAILNLSEDQRKRIHPLICGFNPTDKNSVNHIKQMISMYPGLWEGIGEIFARHNELTRLTPGETTRANDPSLDEIYDYAASVGLPVWMHNDIGTTSMRDPIYLHEISSAVSTHPDTRFVWCHAGQGRNLNITTLRSDVDGMLGKNKNLWIDISWLVYDTVIAPGGKPKDEWVMLIEKYPDRFMIGSDKTGSFGAAYGREMGKYKPLLSVLRPATARNLAHDNLARILMGS